MTVTVIQPDAAAGRDANMFTTLPDTNQGTSPGFYIGDPVSWASRADRGLVAFDVSVLAGEVIDEVLVSLWEDAALSSGGGPASWDTNLRRVLRPWTEAGVTWNKYDGINSWGSGGCSAESDRVSTPSATITLDGSAAEAFVTWGSTTRLVADVQGWADGSLPNEGWLVQADAAEFLGTAIARNLFLTSDYISASRRPKLTVTHHTPESAVSRRPSGLLVYQSGRSTLSWQ